MTVNWKQDWRPFTPTVSNNGGLVLTPNDHPGNHSRFSIVGQICFVSFSQLYAISGTTCTIIQYTLPVNAKFPRNTFSGDFLNESIRATTLDDVDRVSVSRVGISNFPTTGLFHFSFNGFYEAAAQ